MICLRKLQLRQEKYNTKEEGSISVFLTLSLILVLSFLFSMTEAARVNGLQQLAGRKLDMELESLFGAYNRELWENYGLLFLDMAYGSGEPEVRLLEEQLMEADDREGAERHFYQLALRDAKVENYVLATDWEGAEFRRQAGRAAQAGAAEAGLDYLKGQISQSQKLEEESGSLEEKWKKALEAEEEAEKAKEEAEERGEPLSETSEESNQKTLPENPIAYVTQLRTSALLTMVLENPSELSQKAVDRTGSLENRTLFCGNMPEPEGSSVDKLWFIQYLKEYLSCKTQEQPSGHALDYELEYCIAGKETDAENLEEVAERLLLLREAGNFATLMQDQSKKTLAKEIAVAAVGFTGVIPLIKAVETGILLAWCYVESIEDVRCLMAGGKIPLIKETSQWKSDLFHLQKPAEISDSSEEKGMGYEEYLQILLFLTEESRLTCWAMEVVEQNIRLLSGNTAMRMDAMVSGVQVSAVYQAEPLFLNLIPAKQKMNGSYYFTKTGRLAY